MKLDTISYKLDEDINIVDISIISTTSDCIRDKIYNISSHLVRYYKRNKAKNIISIIDYKDKDSKYIISIEFNRGTKSLVKAHSNVVKYVNDILR